jgi:hypothetical protein
LPDGTFVAVRPVFGIEAVGLLVVAGGRYVPAYFF